MYIQLYSGRSKKKTENELLIVVKTLQIIRLSLNYETLLNLVKNYNLKNCLPHGCFGEPHQSSAVL